MKKGDTAMEQKTTTHLVSSSERWERLEVFVREPIQRFIQALLEEEVTALRSDMKAGFDRIEHLLLAEQKREIEDLKTRMTRLEDALAV
jgi:hypothetical protein